jgi:hypothetical protein
MPNSLTPSERAKKILAAWTELASDAKFAGMTREEFAAAVQPSTDTRKEVTKTELKLKADKSAVEDADNATNIVNHSVVNAIKGDTNFGENSELYEACGYVRTADRASGLHRSHPSNGRPNS